jgi:hypothetical protein
LQNDLVSINLFHFGRNEFPWEKLDPEIIKSLQEDPEIGMDKAHLSELAEKEKVRKINEAVAVLPNPYLTQTFNNLGKSEIMAQSKMITLIAIHKELLKRKVNCELINIRGENGKITGCRFTIPIKIETIGGIETLVEDTTPDMESRSPIRWTGDFSNPKNENDDEPSTENN